MSAADFSALFKTLSKREQLAMLKQLGVEIAQASPRAPNSAQHLEWRKYRVWYNDNCGKRTYMFMYARWKDEAIEFCNMVRHTKLKVLSIEEVRERPSNTKQDGKK